MAADPAVRISVPEAWGEVAGAMLLDLLGPFQELEEGERRHFVFYPFRSGAGFVSDEEIRATLPPEPELQAALEIERVLVPGGWEESWKEHFHPQVLGRLYVRPPWESAPEVALGLLDLVLTPGLAFGTGLHPTTRGLLRLLQGPAGAAQDSGGGGAPFACGPLVDCGTGSGILAIAAQLLGYHPVRAFDNDPLAVEATRSNAAANGVEVEVALQEVVSAPSSWFRGSTVLANITLEPVLALLSRLAEKKEEPARLLLSGLLAGDQERVCVEKAREGGWCPRLRLYEKEWVALDLRPAEA